MDDDDDDLTPQRRSWQEQSGTFPVGSDGARRRAKKQTHKSRRVAKRIGKNTTGIRRRRNRKAN
jgi:hypothetical protein